MGKSRNGKLGTLEVGAAPLGAALQQRTLLAAGPRRSGGAQPTERKEQAAAIPCSLFLARDAPIRAARRRIGRRRANRIDGGGSTRWGARPHVPGELSRTDPRDGWAGVKCLS
jgi:hypothetical protein